VIAAPIGPSLVTSLVLQCPAPRIEITLPGIEAMLLAPLSPLALPIAPLLLLRPAGLAVHGSANTL
jgi:hypothetical protein